MANQTENWQRSRNHAQTPADKSAIGDAFGKAAASYDAHAELQRLSGNRLLELAGPLSLGSLLDLGCGSGHFTEVLAKQGHALTGLDLSAEMIKFTQARAETHGFKVQTFVGDIDQLPVAPASIDKVFSNLALQWSDDLSAALAQLKRSLKPGGQLLFTTLVDGSLHELADAWQHVDGRPRINRFLTREQIQRAIANAGLTGTVQFEPITLYFDSVMAVMRSLKGVGATHLHQGRSQGLTGKGQIRALQNAYSRAPQGRPLTYQLCFAIVRPNDA
ncbi:malonyl-ACP O-methyltransferase BioC [Ferrimonas aestuarii]|uniref:Malonyl-[acyl-carrier protein] O-methyltransferase n=1 Tax=Ferrimonas aestuarii TaxID=2569539 RepID=A0A4V5NV57_9GAMM|nr:malonyl-ACP O-methyltransferase BioC [Ferrimonas aestuarii]TKB49182.1 malonyl-ACP O-methyltransferase BioC [Ferrimonas aestuarii]